jgi:2-keto-4-pentenoate hydratase/2-oxohepta-3-ene-1,7-dioic acid hydratase in catechol pathway
MKLISFVRTDGSGSRAAIGAATETNDIVDLALAYQSWLEQRGLSPEASLRVATALIPGDMVAFIEGGEVSREAAEQALDWARQQGSNGPWTLSWDHTQRLCPVPKPPLLRDFMAFEEHMQNIYPKLGRPIPPEWYRFPVYYKGNPASVGTDGDWVMMPPYAQELDFEFELAFVIGRTGRDIRAQDARSYVYGYMIYNDFSARAMQSEEMAVGLGPAKGKDFVGGHVFGPWLVTRDELPSLDGLGMTARVNGALWCQTTSSRMHWSIEDMIVHASRAEIIRAGEIWGTGTVGGGSGAERGEFLKPGDTVELAVERLGVLRNRVVAPHNPAKEC